jgi:hypothetical protein
MKHRLRMMVAPLKRLLFRPILGTRVIPPGASVPPEAFPEDEYPIFCSRCDYQLRGLTGSCCPECGTGFDRGRLLVDQYARERAHRLWEHGPVGRWAARLSVAILVLCAMYIVGMGLIAWAAERLGNRNVRPTARQVDQWTARLVVLNDLAWWGQLLALVTLLCCLLAVARSWRRNRRLRERVLEWLPDSTPGDA